MNNEPTAAFDVDHRPDRRDWYPAAAQVFYWSLGDALQPLVNLMQTLAASTGDRKPVPPHRHTWDHKARR